jgi:hypothetical protein
MDNNYNYSLMNGTFRNQLNKTLSKKTQLRPWNIWDFLLMGLWIFALFGNTLAILVMRSKKMRKTHIALFLKYLAVADISVLTLKFLVILQKRYRIPLYQFCMFVNILPDIAAYISYWLIITTTIERFLAVYYPLQVSQIITKKRCLKLIIMILTFFSLLSFTQYFCLEERLDMPHFCQIKGKCIFFLY